MSERDVRAEIELSAPVNDVWRALTDAEELVRWFPLDAKAGEGVGAEQWISWGEGCSATSRIEVWEPGSHLRLVTDAGEGPGAIQLVVDWHIEAKGDGCLLRLVHSGFGSEASWDDEIASLERGWAWFLLQLRHYLGAHSGTPRRRAWATAIVDRKEVDPATAFARLTGPDGLCVPEGLSAGDAYTLTTADGLTLRGEIVRFAPPFHFAATLSDWNDGLFLAEVEPGATSSVPSILLSTWGANEADHDALAARFAALVEALFPETTGASLSEAFEGSPSLDDPH